MNIQMKKKLKSKASLIREAKESKLKVEKLQKEVNGYHTFAGELFKTAVLLETGNRISREWVIQSLTHIFRENRVPLIFWGKK